MNITAPISVAAGSSLCVSVSGVVGVLHATVKVGGKTISPVVTTKPGGMNQICISVPSNAKGAVTIDLTDGSGTPYSESVIIG